VSRTLGTVATVAIILTATGIFSQEPNGPTKPSPPPNTISTGAESAPESQSATEVTAAQRVTADQKVDRENGKAGGQPPAAVADHDVPSWVRVASEFAKILLSWPLLVALLVAYLVFSRFAPYRIARVLRPFRSVKLFGAEFQLSEEVGADAEQAIEILRKQAKRQIDVLVETYAVRAKLEAVVHDVQEALRVRGTFKDLRFTLHTPDILFADTLYQLVDYYPRGGGRGRTFSFRFGIIGLAWRARRSFVRGEVPTDPEKLVRRWGMSNEEAVASGGGRQSFAAILLNDNEETPIAIFYMDTSEKHAFGADNAEESDEQTTDPKTRAEREFRDNLIKLVLEVCKQKGLIASLAKIGDSLSDRRPSIHIHER